VLLFVAVCLVAINMRMTITGVGPLLEDIAADQGVSPASLGLLASIPLLAWAVVSPLAQGLAARIGLNPAVGWSLVVLTIGTVWRSLPGSLSNLWLGTALVGAAGACRSSWASTRRC
jgi:CP family cyanate transporter-like MFS transporter